MEEVLGKFCVPLEGRFSCVRRQESNLGNWVCDVLLAATGADLVLLNSGTFRSDQVRMEQFIKIFSYSPFGPFNIWN